MTTKHNDPDMQRDDHEVDVADTIPQEKTHDKTDSDKTPETKPYSVYSHGEKWAIVAIASFAGLFR